MDRISAEEQIAILKKHRDSHPKCNGHETLACIRIIQDLQDNPAIAMERVNFAKCRFAKTGDGAACPPGRE